MRSANIEGKLNKSTEKNLDSGLQNDRVINFFISSTFDDMKEERDEIVKHIFLELRKKCEERMVVWNYVDFRWGINKKQSAKGLALPICLREIDKCRPYFIGILGDCYGTVPEDIDPLFLEQEPWLEEYKDRSYTELEILHGALNNPENDKPAV